MIEDAAQAIGSTSGVTYAGGIGDIGVFSFNFGKHISCGEGGMIVTDNQELAFRCRLMMNHAEAVINELPERMIRAYTIKKHDMVGFNMRMTEFQAAVVRCQLKKFDMRRVSAGMSIRSDRERTCRLNPKWNRYRRQPPHPQWQNRRSRQPSNQTGHRLPRRQPTIGQARPGW